MISIIKKIIAITVLSSFLAISFFSFAIMLHEPAKAMANDCPFSTLGQPLCPQDILAVTIHHLLAYHNFLNIPLISNFTLFLIVAFLSLISAWISILKNRQPPSKAILNRLFNDSPPKQSGSKKIIQWLARLENSPTYI